MDKTEVGLFVLIGVLWMYAGIIYGGGDMILSLLVNRN